MSCKLRFVIAILATVGCLWFPSPGQGQEGLREYSPRSETGGLAGAFLDPFHQRPVWYEASAENGVLTLYLGLYEQSVTLRHGHGELHLDSSNNTAGGFSTLSDEEKGILRRLAIYLDQELETQSAFDASVICAIRNLSSWPADMPLSVSIDSAVKTVGEFSVSMEEIQEARRQAMDDLRIQFPIGEEGIVGTEAFISLCRQIGKTRRACYPTSLKPYKEKCENVLLGGTTCRGRCGTTCSGLCTQQRYTQDCHSHDRCADVYGIAHRYCNFIFPPTFDDCAAATDCVDLPGVWSITFRWSGSPQGSSAVNINPNRKITSEDGAIGTWTATDTTAKFTFSTGCKPIYTGTLSGNRLTASGTMKCTTRSGNGTWSASKTNGILSAGTKTQTNDPAAALDSRGALSSPPD